MNSRRRNMRRRPRPGGVTLLELVISTSIMSLLFVGMASAISLAASSIPNSRSLSTVTVSTQRVLEQLAGELAYAIALTRGTATTLEFTVADRDGVFPSPETIKYSWAGAGSPLLRQYNSTAGVAVIEGVQSVRFTLETAAGPTGTVVTTVRCFIQTTADSRTRLSTNVRLLNRPAPPS